MTARAMSMPRRAIGRGNGWRLIWLHLRTSGLLWLIPVAAAVTIWFVEQLTYQRTMFWSNASYGAGQSYVLLGPIAAAFSCWVAGSVDRRRMDDQIASTAMSTTSTRVLFLVASIVTGIVLGMTGMIAIVLWTLRLRPWGMPYGWLLAGGIVATVALSVVGAVIGTIWKNRLAVPVALLATFFVTVAWDAVTAGSGMVRWYRGASYWHVLQDAGPRRLSEFIEERVFPEYIASIIVNLGFAALAFGIGWLVIRRSAASLATLALGAVLVGGGLWGLHESATIDGRFASAVTPIDIDYACATVQGIETCVHPALEQQLPQISDQMGRVFAPLAEVEAAPHRFVQSDWVRPPATEEGTAPFTISGTDTNNLDVVAFNAVERLIEWQEPPQPDNAWYVVSTWLLDRADVPRFWQGPDQEPDAVMDEALARFTALPDAERTAWLDANWDALITGQLTIDDLP